MKLRKPCEHDRYDEHGEAYVTLDGQRGAVTTCPGGEFLADDALDGLPPPDEIRSYVNNGFKSGWSEDYPNAAAWLSQLADLLDALIVREGAR